MTNLISYGKSKVNAYPVAHFMSFVLQVDVPMPLFENPENVECHKNISPKHEQKIILPTKDVNKSYETALKQLKRERNVSINITMVSYVNSRFFVLSLALMCVIPIINRS